MKLYCSNGGSSQCSLKGSPEAQSNDGEITIGRVVVRAKDTEEADIPKMPVNRRYLLFLQKFDDDGRLYVTHTPLVVTADRLSYTEPVEVPGQLPNPLLRPLNRRWARPDDPRGQAVIASRAA